MHASISAAGIDSEINSKVASNATNNTTNNKEIVVQTYK